MTIQKEFDEAKNHPLAVLLLRYYEESAFNPIPPIWRSFLEDTTESSSMELMYTQLPKWGLSTSQIPPDLRGRPLFDHLMHLKFIPILARIETQMSSAALGFIPAMEAVFRELKIIPDEATAKTRSSEYGLRANLDYSYEERGTLRYSIKRTVPASVFIPPKFIKAFCGQDQTDDQIWSHFLQGLQTRFRTSIETPAPPLNEMLFRPEEYYISPRTGAREMDSDAFPVSMNHRGSCNEGVSRLRLSNPVPDPVSTAEFRLPETPRKDPLTLDVWFPAANPQQNQPEVTRAYRALLGVAVTNPDDPGTRETKQEFVEFLRITYQTITKAERFLAQRKVAVEAAAGL